jgi:hypothetical protein
MAKPFYFWQTSSKKAKFGRFGPQKEQMATLEVVPIKVVIHTISFLELTLYERM